MDITLHEKTYKGNGKLWKKRFKKKRRKQKTKKKRKYRDQKELTNIKIREGNEPDKRKSESKM
jgi:hypothetical protein